ncbi:MAG: glycosyltransferase family 4 protein [Nitrospirae bacterium]|nr:glycosyltransferase family 4 protein [Nitrospirota bacterium]
MNKEFETDPYPGRPKILFIGWPESSHTHSWIDLLDGAEFNVCLFALPSGIPPETWQIRTYVTVDGSAPLDTSTRYKIYPPLTLPFIHQVNSDKIWNFASQHFSFAKRYSIEKCLANVVSSWKPDIVHTLGFDAASYFYLRAREQYHLQGIGKWVAQVRGGPDLALYQFLPDYLEKIRNVLTACDQLIADNQLNYEYAVMHGLGREKISSLGVVPGTGGIDIEHLSRTWSELPSRRERIIVWPKTYEVPSSKALPVFEAIRIAWDRIKPCRIYMLWTVQPEIKIWFQKMLPEDIRNSCSIMDKIPRQQVLDLMAKARVMLAPSLSDGVPNSMLEAMACGAFPIVSPIETIAPVVENRLNVLFARNLFPHEIAEALSEAMTDDELVDNAARRNVGHAKKLADRSLIRQKLVEYYNRLYNGRMAQKGIK